MPAAKLPNLYSPEVLAMLDNFLEQVPREFVHRREDPFGMDTPMNVWKKQFTFRQCILNIRMPIRYAKPYAGS